MVDPDAPFKQRVNKYDMLMAEDEDDGLEEGVEDGEGGAEGEGHAMDVDGGDGGGDDGADGGGGAALSVSALTVKALKDQVSA